MDVRDGGGGMMERWGERGGGAERRPVDSECGRVKPTCPTLYSSTEMNKIKHKIEAVGPHTPP